MAGSPIDPPFQYINVTLSDTEPLKYHSVPMRCKAISFATAGDLAIRDDQGTKVIIPNGALVAGIMHPISTDLIYSTGTGASNIVAYF